MVARTLICLLTAALLLISSAPPLHAGEKLELGAGQGINGIVLAVALSTTVDEMTCTIPLVPLLVISGIYSPFAVEEVYGLTTPEARLINFGSLTGIGAGLLFSEIKGVSSRETATYIFLTDSIFTLGAGAYAFNRERELTSGDTSLIISATLFSSLFSLITAGAVSPDIKDEQFYGTILAGGGAGLTASILMTDQLDWSRRRVLVMDMCVIGGGFTGFGISRLMKFSRRSMLVTAALSMAGGAVAGYFLTDGFAPEPKPPLQSGASGRADRTMNFTLMQRSF